MEKCFNCFQEKTGDVCPHCGYDPASDAGKYPLALPHGSILAGQYVVGRVLGQGGFGITYVALDNHTGQKVAIKEYFPDTMATRVGSHNVSAFTGQREENFSYGLQCFLSEAQVLASLMDVPHVVRVHSYFEENGTAYFVMDYVEGSSLDAYVRKRGGRLSWEEVKGLLLPVVDALAVVHSRGIIHRDVTPDNIFITEDGTVKLLDFGAARYSLGDRSRSLDVVLKHGYAPKEQYTRRGRQGPYTDVYSLGATFYYCLTGRIPPESIDRIDEDDLVMPSSFGVRIPEEAEDAIEKALAVQPADRYQSMAEFKAGLTAGEQVQERKIVDELAHGMNAGAETARGHGAGMGSGTVHNSVAGTETVQEAKAESETTHSENVEMESSHNTKVESEAIRNADDRMDSDHNTEKESGSIFRDVEDETQEDASGHSPVKKIVFCVAGVAAILLVLVAGFAIRKKWSGTLMADHNDGFVFNTKLNRDEITSITFLDTLNNAPDDAMDFSKVQDGSVLGWTVENSEGYDLYIAGEGGVTAPVVCTDLFCDYENVTYIDFGGGFHTENSKYMKKMFRNCSSLESVDVSGFDTSKVKDMSSMFEYCLSLGSLDVSGFDTSKVKNMSTMFDNCRSLESLDVSGFVTSKVKDMSFMFNDCRSLESLDVSGFATSKVKDMACMFRECKSLESLDVSGFVTSKVKDMRFMFECCFDLESLNVSGFDTSKVTNMSYMFSGCSAVTIDDISGWDVSNVSKYDKFMSGSGWESLFE